MSGVTRPTKVELPPGITPDGKIRSDSPLKPRGWVGCPHAVVRLLLRRLTQSHR